MNGGLSMPSMTTSSWLSAMPPPMPPMPPGNMKLKMLAIRELEAGDADRLRRARVEEPVAPRARLDDQVARRVARRRAGRRRGDPRRSPDDERLERLAPGSERLAPHADGVDLVDEDDALAAPLAGELLGPAREDADDDRVDPDERRGEAGARASR